MADTRGTFNIAIKAIFNNWPALQFAVGQQAGGKESAAIAEWMVGVVEQYFKDNDDLEPEEVAEFLATVMDTELNTLVEDGSDLETGQSLCNMYRMIEEGITHKAMEEAMNHIPKCDLSLFKEKVIDVEMTDEAANSTNGLQVNNTSEARLRLDAGEMTQEPMDDNQRVTAGIQGLQLNGSDNKEREPTELEKRQLQDAAEGWSVVTKKGRKKNQ
ncbi:hypothetical protein Pcinc_012091 [Petrolisthes cinctipes]|uniref:Pre-rRNA-processing protein TSR2 homolog n=1 Tax=Petrolisthes cinctipes TaxID=88211 RepID=A0AAE1FZJ5_PETCI|nr:hypothetical protein Pcinc_012091 [Petrolisthes cinctipes]